MNKKILSLFVSIFFICSLFSCIDNEFSSTTKVNPEKSVFGDSSTIIIPDNFDWDTYNSISLDVKVKAISKSNNDYIISVYDFNPLFNDSSKLLASGVCKGGNTIHFNEIDVLGQDSSICIQQLCPDGNKITMVQDISSSSSFLVDFNGNSLKSLNRSSEAGNKEVFPFVVSIDEEYNVPSSAKILEDGSVLSDIATTNNKGVYYLPKRASCSLKDFDKDIKISLYVAGTLTISDSYKLNDYGKLIILDGGKLEYKNETYLTLSSNSMLEVQKGGIIESSNNTIGLTIEANENSKVLFQGDVKVKTLKIYDDVEMKNEGNLELTKNLNFYNNTLFSNSGDIKVDNKLQLYKNAKLSNTGSINTGNFYLDSDNDFYNGGFLIANTIDVHSDGYITNEGKIQADNFETNNNSCLVCKTGSYLTCEEWNSYGTYVYFENDAMVDVTDKTIMEYNRIYGSEEGNSLFQSKEIEFTYNNLLYGDFDIATDKYTENSRWYYRYYNYRYRVMRNYVWLSSYGSSLTTITTTKYSTGNNYIVQEETQPEFPKRVSNTNNYTFVMEDLFPIFGDFDMNDLVVSLDSIENYMYENNYVEKSIIHLRLRAVGGATAGIGFFLQLDGIEKNKIASVENSNTLSNFNNFSISKGLENGQGKPVIPIFDDAHDMLDVNSNVFVNTFVEGSNNTYKDDVPVTLTITYTDDANISAEFLNKKYLNFFGAKGVENGRRYEIHAPGYDYTDLNKTKIDNTGYNMWALIIPGEFQYPTEYTSIIDAYPDFSNWVYSDKQENLDWYDHPDKNFIYK